MNVFLSVPILFPIPASCSSFACLTAKLSSTCSTARPPAKGSERQAKRQQEAAGSTPHGHPKKHRSRRRRKQKSWFLFFSVFWLFVFRFSVSVSVSVWLLVWGFGVGFCYIWLFWFRVFCFGFWFMVVLFCFALLWARCGAVQRCAYTTGSIHQVYNSRRHFTIPVTDGDIYIYCVQQLSVSRYFVGRSPIQYSESKKV